LNFSQAVFSRPTTKCCKNDRDGTRPRAHGKKNYFRKHLLTTFYFKEAVARCFVARFVLINTCRQRRPGFPDGPGQRSQATGESGSRLDNRNIERHPDRCPELKSSLSFPNR
jgi:hypothetical protein